MNVCERRSMLLKERETICVHLRDKVNVCVCERET